MIDSITVKLVTEGQEIEGMFRAIIAITDKKDGYNKDVLILGNSVSSILITLSDVKIKSIKMVYSNGENIKQLDTHNGTACSIVTDNHGITTRSYYLSNRQQAYSILTRLYAEYKNDSSTIITKNCYLGAPYIISETETDNIFGLQRYNNNTEHIEHAETSTWKQHNTVPYFRKEISYKKVLKPRINKSDKMTDFLNRILEGHFNGRDNRKQKYSGQLTDYS